MFHQAALPVPLYDRLDIVAAQVVDLVLSDSTAQVAETIAVVVVLEMVVAVILVVVLPQKVAVVVVLKKVAAALYTAAIAVGIPA